jgi:hypothetical protein
MKPPRQISDNPATVKRRERKIYAELKHLESEWNKEVAAFMAKGMNFDEAWVAAGGTIVPDISRASA